MARPSTPHSRGGWPAQDDDGWGPSTSVYSASSGQAATAGPSSRVARGHYPNTQAKPQPRGDVWVPGGPASGRDQRAVRTADRRTERSVQALQNRNAVHERGLPWWGALLVVIAIAAVGGMIDTLGSNQVRGGFNVGIVAASIVGILVVKRSHMFPIVIAPPIVYSGGALFQLYVRSSGLHDKKVILDAAANYLVYGFPAIAAATAAVLIIAGIRMITRK
jgi:hypothetical protein